MVMVTRTAGAALVLIALWFVSPVATQQRSAYDYWRVQRQMIERGQQAIFMCNGLFTSNRTIEQIFAQELKFLTRADRLAHRRRLRRRPRAPRRRDR